MIRHSNRWGYLFFCFIALLVLFFSLFIPAQAQGIVQERDIKTGEEIDNDLILTGDNPVMDGVVIGDMLVYGETVTINGTVRGSVISIGGRVIINGQVEGTTIIGGGALELGPETVLGRNLYFVGGRLDIPEGATIGRDLYALCLSASLSGEIGRNTKALIGLVEVLRLIFGGPLLQGGIGAPALVQNQSGLAMASLLPVSFGWDSQLLSAPDRPAVEPAIQAGTQLDSQKINQWLKSLYQIFVPLLILGLLAAWLIPAFLSQASELVRKRALLSAGAGLVTIIVGYAGAILLAVLIVVLGYFLTTISLSSFAYLVWGLGLSGLGLAFSVFILCAWYGSKIVLSHLVGKLILGRLAPGAAGNRFWPLLLGLVIYTLLASIPTLGWVISILVTLFGLGAIVLAYQERRRRQEA